MQHGLSKRQRQIMEAVYSLKQATVTEVRRAIPDPPSYSAVRTTMNILEDRGLLAHTLEGRKYCYFPTIPHRKARQSAIQHLLRTYFDNSVEQAVAALVRADPKGLSDEEYQRLLTLIEKARNGR
ncbi:MAG: BlaI/MecI/CopY family transcriptional regulator, partial [Spirochaetales bacterium]|nr:BlaI/MecI/CopY family transcriptional regulator [Spirochaetales bacterium]